MPPPTTTSALPYVPVLITESAIGQNNISFEVPEGKVWDFRTANLSATTSSTVGVRMPRLRVFDGATDAVVLDTCPMVGFRKEEEASFTWARGLTLLEAPIPPEIQTAPLPFDFVLPAGFIINVFDSNNIDQGDNFVASIIVGERDEA